ncbi:Alpha/Beta hydrolase protein [Xylariales sp. PMI_506]|nr:Alpha/Beta hydrolase protein [Xylariales sp. PMI_506]
MLTIGELYQPAWLQTSYPTCIRQYDARPHLPVRVFLPHTYDFALAQPIPVLFTIHGGGFTTGSATDDDRWNRLFADSQRIIVIGLNYSHAPFAPYPTALHDLEAVILATIGDVTVPMDRNRIAIGGSDSGANLALAVAQLPAVRQQVRPRAALSICGLLELAIPTAVKAETRWYKASLSSARAAATDPLANSLPAMLWAYVPAGTNLIDPLCSPFYADAAVLPPHVCLVAAELDLLAHDAWRMACRLAARSQIPDLEDRVGRPAVGAIRGALDLADERFGFEQVTGRGHRSVKWLLVPDVLHEFDMRMPDALAGDDETRNDASEKTKKVMCAVGQWLRDVAWLS